jgi:hypothetical protein
MSMKAKGESDRARKLCKLGFVFSSLQEKSSREKSLAQFMGKGL